MLVAFGACNTTKNKDKTIGEAKPTTFKSLLGDLSKNYPSYKSMASDIKLEADIDGSSYKATGLVRHVPDKGLFISVKKFGFEIGQVLMTKDSFFVLNRWEKEYIREPISIIEREYNIRGDYLMVEELLTGIPRVGEYRKQTKSIIENDFHRADVASIYKGINLAVWLTNPSHEVAQALYQDRSTRGVRMKYGMETKNNLILERELHTENIEDNDIHIKLNYRNPLFNKAKLPEFNIPSHYSRRRM